MQDIMRWAKNTAIYVWNNVIPSAFERNHSFYFPQELDMDKLNAACEKLMGTHDFIGFSALKKSKNLRYARLMN